MLMNVKLLLPIAKTMKFAWIQSETSHAKVKLFKNNQLVISFFNIFFNLDICIGITNCSSQAQCFSGNHTFACVCNGGFSGNGHVCTGNKIYNSN